MVRPEFTRETFAKFLAAKVPNDLEVKKLAHQVGMTKSYLNEIVKGSKPAPKKELQEAIVEALGLDEIDATEFYHLACESRNEYCNNEEIRKNGAANFSANGELLGYQNWKKAQKKKRKKRMSR